MFIGVQSEGWNHTGKVLGWLAPEVGPDPSLQRPEVIRSSPPNAETGSVKASLGDPSDERPTARSGLAILTPASISTASNSRDDGWTHPGSEACLISFPLLMSVSGIGRGLIYALSKACGERA